MKYKLLILLSFLLVCFISCTSCGTEELEDNNSKGKDTELPEEDNDKEALFFPIYYSFDKGSQETVRVYVQVSDSLYAMFRILHEVNGNKNKNLWRITTSYMCEYKDEQMTELYPILTDGENEFVWYSARNGVQDATGGFHGNERIDLDPYGNVEFHADAEVLNLSQSINLTPCESFYYIQHTTMHETGTGGVAGSANYVPVPGNPVECYHEKRTVFDKGGFDTYNKLIWAKNETPVLRNYFGLFCVTPDVSKKGMNESGKEELFNDSGGMKLVSNDSKITMYEEDKCIKVICDARLIKPAGHAITTMVWDKAGSYNKYYARLGTGSSSGIPINTNEGDIWESEASLYFEIM